MKKIITSKRFNHSIRHQKIFKMLSILSVMFLIGCKPVEKVSADDSKITSSSFTYVVQKGDSLSKIANIYNTTVDKLVRDNNIEDPNKIEIGQEIIILIDIINTDSQNESDIIDISNNYAVANASLEEGLRVEKELTDGHSALMTYHWDQAYEDLDKITLVSNNYIENTNLVDPKVWDSIIDTGKPVKGIDISRYQGNLSSDKLINNDDIQFVYVKISDFNGQQCMDPFFARNVQMVLNSGKALGLYYFPNAYDDHEVDVVIDILDRLKSKGIYSNLSIALDIEYSGVLNALAASSPTSAQIELINGLKNTVNRLEEAGYSVTIYTQNGKGGCNIQNFLKYGICDNYWLARYENNNISYNISSDVHQPSLNIEPQMVQYTQKGVLANYSGYLDIDYTFENIPKEMIQNGYNGINIDNNYELGGYTRN